jgi:hypothetical protein
MMEETEQVKSAPYTFFIANAAIQFGAILAYQNMMIIWPLYVVMGFLSLLIVLQTIAAGSAFAYIIPTNEEDAERKKERNLNTSGIRILISIIYMVSCYHIYLAGFVGFAWFALAHVFIQFFTSVFGVIK